MSVGAEAEDVVSGSKTESPEKKPVRIGVAEKGCATNGGREPRKVERSSPRFVSDAHVQEGAVNDDNATSATLVMYAVDQQFRPRTVQAGPIPQAFHCLSPLRQRSAFPRFGRSLKPPKILVPCAIKNHAQRKQ